MKRFTKGCNIPSKVATFFILLAVLASSCQTNNHFGSKGTTTSEKQDSLTAAEWVKAIMDGETAKIEAGIALRFDPNLTNSHGDSAFMWAAYRGRNDWVQAMLKQGGNPLYKGSYGKTALHLAAGEGHIQVVQTLLKIPGCSDLVDEKGRTALEFAVWQNQHAVVQTMLEQSVDPQAVDNRPLAAAVENKAPDLVRILVLAGAQPSAADNSGTSPLQKALSMGAENLFTQSEITTQYPDLPVTIRDAYKIVIVNQAEQPKLDHERMAAAFHQRINEIRAEHGLSKLTYDPQLQEIARLHSQDMAKREFFAHVNPDGADPTARAKAHKIATRATLANFYYKEGIGENIYKTFLFSESRVEIRSGTRYITRLWRTEDTLLELAVKGWMASPGHRANILNKNANRQGLGIAVDNEDGIFFTQNLF